MRCPRRPTLTDRTGDFIKWLEADQDGKLDDSAGETARTVRRRLFPEWLRSSPVCGVVRDEE